MQIGPELTGGPAPPGGAPPIRKRPFRLFHLAARFMDAALSRRLTPAEQDEAARLLASEAERAMFWGQSRADQRHGLAAARSAAEARPGRTDLIRAALLHDAGKRRVRLGAAGRVWTELRAGLGLAPTERGAAYLDHGRLGSEELAAAGAEPLVSAYARFHHEGRPGEISSEDWAVLQAADRARLPVFRRRPAARRSKTPAGRRLRLRWRRPAG